MESIVKKAMEVLNGRMSCNCTDGYFKFVLLKNGNNPYSFDEDNGLVPVSEWTVDEDYEFWPIDE